MSDLVEQLRIQISPQGLRDPYEHLLEKAADEIERLSAANAELLEAVKELNATVRGEWPSLLDEDSGGNAALACKIKALIAKHEGTD